MNKILLSDLNQVLAYNVRENKTCIEILFCIDNCKHYSSCWLGKLITKDQNKEVYWFGLTPDGAEAYDFDSKEDLLNAKVFNGVSLVEMWDKITIISIDSLEPSERLQYYR